MKSDGLVSVVIPFFQKESGILRRALESIEHQDQRRLKQIIVVDDGSPVSAQTELSTYNGAVKSKIFVIECPNRGPGAARNEGLNAVAADVEFVAFLDSDDLWHAEHLQRATEALELGFDFYFCDSVEAGESRSHFQTDCRDVFHRLRPIPGYSTLFTYPGLFFAQILKKSIIATSSVVYRFRSLADVRFPTDFSVGEDRFFWLSLLSRTNKVVCSDYVGFVYGKGINVYRSVRWGDRRLFRVLTHEMRMRRAVESCFPLSEEQREINNEILRSKARTFLLNAKSRFFRGDVTALLLCAKLLAEFPREAVSAINHRISRRET